MPKPRRSSDWNYGGRKWRLSRSKIDLFTDCARCFYLDNKLGVARPRPPSFTLNLAVDALLKKEFDTHRKAQSSHPLMEKYGLKAVPFEHKQLNTWRENFEGIEYHDKETGFVISGAIDDVWVNPKGELMIVDYKATSKDGKIEELGDSPWEKQYGRQMEIYQWLFRKNGFNVSNTGYFVYVNGRKDGEAFDAKLEFDVTLIPHTGNANWIEGVLTDIKKCLESDEIPTNGEECEFCNYRKLAREALGESTKALKNKTVKKNESTLFL